MKRATQSPMRACSENDDAQPALIAQQLMRRALNPFWLRASVNYIVALQYLTFMSNMSILPLPGNKHQRSQRRKLVDLLFLVKRLGVLPSTVKLRSIFF